jgi:hypothetical protein
MDTHSAFRRDYRFGRRIRNVARVRTGSWVSILGLVLSGQHLGAASYNTAFPPLEDDACSWDAAGIPKRYMKDGRILTIWGQYIGKQFF